MKATGYVRVSTAEQAETGTSLDTQREEIARYAQAHGATLGEIYADEGISGATTEGRPGFMRLLADAQTKKFDTLIIHSLTRFGRNARETLTNYDELEGLGVRLVFLKENIDTSTPFGRMARTMAAAYAEMERDVIKERMEGGRKVKWKKASAFIGKVPFGYRWDGKKGAIVIDKAEAQIYKHIVDLYLHEGLSDLGIALRLKQEGIKLKGRKYPATQTIAYILKNPVYYGHYVVNRHEYKGDRRTGKKKPDSQHIDYPMPAIVSKTLWDKIQEKRTFNKTKSKRVSVAQDYFLRDVMECGECGGKIMAVTYSRPRADGSLPRYYGCWNHKATQKRLDATGRKRCKLPLIPADQIEQEIYYEIVQTLTLGGFHLGDKYAASILEDLLDTAQYEGQIGNLEAALMKNREELERKELARERLYDMLEDAGSYKDEFYRKLRQKDDEILTIKSILADLEAKIEALRDAQANSESFLAFIRENQAWLASVRTELAAFSQQDKKWLIESVVGGRIPVWLGKTEEGELTWAVGGFKIAPNTNIFEALAAEGKLPTLDKNSCNRNGLPGSDGGPLPRGQGPR
jgi:site-specific DNA recombinase